jgi:hypothetical protein
LLLLLDDRRIRKQDPDPYLVLMDPDPGGPKTYGFADPYLHHWFKVYQCDLPSPISAFIYTVMERIPDPLIIKQEKP